MSTVVYRLVCRCFAGSVTPVAKKDWFYNYSGGAMPPLPTTITHLFTKGIE